MALKTPLVLDANGRPQQVQSGDYTTSGGPETALGTSGSVTVDVSTTRHFTITPSAAVTLAVSNDVNGYRWTIVISSSAFSITWWSGIKWAGGAAPTQPVTSGHRLHCSFRRNGSGDYDGWASDNF
jgi:hypothetical protein